MSLNSMKKKTKMSLHWGLRVRGLFGAQKSHGRISEAFWSDFLLIQATRICVANINRHLPIHLDDLDGSN